MRFAFRRANDSADSPPYLPLLKLHTAPFASKAGSGFFYADAERTQYLDMLQHLTQYSEELLLVVGTEGIGKSALLDKYLERSEEHWRLCRLDGGQGIDLDALFARVAECFALELAKIEPAQLLAALSQHLDSLLEQQLSVLLIDDAHALSDDALEMVLHLAALEGQHGKLIRVLMFADSAIEARLASARFAQAAAPHRLQLKPLQQADSSAYLLHRLQQAGYSGASPFSAEELQQLHRQAQGVPAQLNQVAHALLLERLKGDGPRFSLSGNSVRMGVAATALIGTVLGMHDRINTMLGAEGQNSMALTAERPVLRLADKDNPWAVVIRDGESIQISCGNPEAQTVALRPTPAAPALETQPLMQKPLLQPVTPPPVAEEPVKEPIKEPEKAPPKEPEVIAQAPVEEPAAPTETAEPATTEAPTTTPLVIKPPVPSIIPELPAGLTVDSPEATPAEEKPAEPEKLVLDSVSPSPVIGSTKPQTIAILGSGLEPGSKVAVSWAGKVKALDASQVVVQDTKRMELTITTGVEPAMWAVQVSSPSKQRSNVLRFQVEAPKAEPVVEVKKAPVKSAAKKPATKKPAVTKGGKMNKSSWVAAQPAGNFTLQLLASSEPAAIKDFVAEHPALKGPLGRFEQQRGDKRLHVLTQGSYSGRAQAEKAAKGLPDKLQPWIRDFAGIKKVMTAPAKIKAKAKPKPKPVTATEVAASGGIKDTAWVWSQNPGQYTIQLAGAGDEAAIEAVMQGSSLPGELAVVQTLRNGKPWYALIYGRFADKAAAQGTAARLPAALKKAGPWIRQFSALQDEIGQATAR